MEFFFFHYFLLLLLIFIRDIFLKICVQQLKAKKYKYCWHGWLKRNGKKQKLDWVLLTVIDLEGRQINVKSIKRRIPARGANSGKDQNECNNCVCALHPHQYRTFCIFYQRNISFLFILIKSRSRFNFYNIMVIPVIFAVFVCYFSCHRPQMYFRTTTKFASYYHRSIKN